MSEELVVYVVYETTFNSDEFYDTEEIVRKVFYHEEDAKEFICAQVSQNWWYEEFTVDLGGDEDDDE